jgi:hypothetical protein
MPHFEYSFVVAITIIIIITTTTTTNGEVLGLLPVP